MDNQKKSRKPKEINYISLKHTRFTEEQVKLIRMKARETGCTDSEFIRTAVVQYINRNITDTEIIHAALVDLNRKQQYVENKLELLAMMIFQQAKLTMEKLPDVQNVNNDMVDVLMEEFKQKCVKTLKTNHEGLLESMILDAYETSGGDS